MFRLRSACLRRTASYQNNTPWLHANSLSEKDIHMKTENSLTKHLKLIPRLMKYAGKDKKWMIISWILAALGGIASLGPYVCIYFLVRELMMRQSDPSGLLPGQLDQYGWLAVQAVALSYMLYGFALGSSHWAAFRLIGRLRIKMLRHLEKLPLGFHLANPSGALRKTIEKNCENSENFVAHQLPDTIQATVIPVAFLACMLWFDWRLCLICLTPIVIGFWILNSMLEGYRGDFLTQYQNAMSSMGAGAVEYVRGISVVKVFGQSLYAFTRFHEAILNYKKFITAYSLSVEKPMAIYITAINGFFFLLIPSGILMYCYAQGPTARESFVISFIFFMIFTPLVPVMLTRIMYSSSNKLICSQALDSMEEILKQPLMEQPAVPKTPDSFKISFNDVSFAYSDDTPNVLTNFSFTAKPGGITALVGHSGGGKTTIINLIARFWDIDSGSITVGGLDLRDLEYEKWMSQVGLVSQEPKLFAMSIADNVSFCNPSASRQEIEGALTQAQCNDITAKFHNGMDTMIGADGVHLSYGEMQRICLARAILQNPPVLLLDEVMAFADPDNEYLIQQALTALMQDKTVIMVAHRLSTVKDAQNILVLDNGNIVESGDHHTLMKQQGIYRKMFDEYRTASRWKLGGAHA